MHLNVQPVDNISTAARLADVLFSQFSIDCWCLGFLSQSAERPKRPEPPLCGTVGLPPSYRGAHGGRTGYYRSLVNSVCVSERASSPALRADNACSALALSVVVVVAHV